MTTFWRRQTQSAGNYPANPTTQAGIPYWPQTLPPSTVVGRLPGAAGPTEAIPFALLAALISAAKNVQIVTDPGTTNILASTQILIFNKASASASPCNLPSVFGRNQVDLELYDWTGLAGDITLTPFGTEGIMGANSPWTILSGGLVQTGGSVRMLSLETLSGWLLR